MSGQVVSLFDTMLVVDELPNAAAINAQLLPVIMARRARSSGVTISNVGGWQSEHDVQDWAGAALQPVLARVIELAGAHSVDIVSPNAPRHRWVTDIWANVSPPQASNQMHSHPGAYWSAVYYVDDGGVGADDGGQLIIEDPRMPMILMTMPNLRFRKPDGSYNEPQLGLRPKSGRILMFPSWLNHGVAPHKGPRERVSIAINLLAVPDR